MKRSRYVVIGALVAALGAGILYTSSRTAAQEKAVAATPALASDPVLAAPGIVEPASEEREIAAEATGVLAEVLVDENEQVHRGQPLATLENAELRARLDGARAALSLREAELRRLVNGARVEERREIAAGLEEAEALARFAQSERARDEKLFASGAIAQALVDQARQADESAAARVRAARARVTLIEAPARADEVAQAKARVAAAKADVAVIEAQLDKTILRAPIDGTVLRRLKDAGETVQPSLLVMTIGDLSRLRVRTEIDEADIAKIQIGQRVTVSADAHPGKRFGGRVVRVASRLGTKTVQTERPSEKADTKVLEAMVELDADVKLPVGLRVDVLVAGS